MASRFTSSVPLCSIDTLAAYYSANLVTETLFTFMVAMTILALVHTEPHPQARAALAVGALCGLAALCRPAAFGLAFFVAVLFLLANPVCFSALGVRRQS